MMYAYIFASMFFVCNFCVVSKTNTNFKLLKYDQELVRCEFETFSEFDIQFPPSYPFKEDINHPEGYMEYRCPAWCDRIVLNDKLKTLINTSSRIDPTYDMIGATTCMGDHKVILYKIF